MPGPLHERVLLLIIRRSGWAISRNLCPAGRTGPVPLQRLSVKAVHPAATADPDVVYHIRETCLIVSSFLPAFLPRYTSKLEVISISGGIVDNSIGQHAGITF